MKGLASICLLLVIAAGTGTDARAHGPLEIYGDVTVRPAPLPPPASEQLAYARRLFEADRYGEAVDAVLWLADGNGREAEEALLLMGRAEYSRGDVNAGRKCFEDLVFRFTAGLPVQCGRLSLYLARAATWLLEEGAWGEAGRYVDLLRRVDQDAVARLAKRLEERLDGELAEYQPLLHRHRYDTKGVLGAWVRTEQGGGVPFWAAVPKPTPHAGNGPVSLLKKAPKGAMKKSVLNGRNGCGKNIRISSVAFPGVPWKTRNALSCCGNWLLRELPGMP